jgi:hypothetical protein
VFTYSDALHILGVSEEAPEVSEVFHAKTVIKQIDKDELIRMFPEIASSDNKNVVYAPCIICHSLPTLNAKGRGITLPTLINSAQSVRDNLVNIEHELESNDIGSERDMICGHIKGAYIDSLKFKGTDIPLIPDSSVPLFALPVLYSRHSHVPRIVKDYANGQQWHVSMECGHNILKSCLLYEGEFIPFKEASPDMLECVGSNGIKKYKGKDIGLVLGGKSGKVNFWGLALTKTPADSDASILRMFTVTNRETASRNLYFPIRIDFLRKKEKDENFIEESSDNLLVECASIKPIGRTTESDGHSHLVLSDGTIVPERGHSHYIKTYILTQGNKASFTASLSEHSEQATQPTAIPQFLYHTHQIDIDMKKSVKNEPEDSKSIFSESSSVNTGGDSMPKLLDQLKEAVNGIKEIASKVKDQQGVKEDETLLKAIDTVSKFNIDNAIEVASDEAVEAKVASGDFVKKEEHEKAVAKAVEEERMKINLELEKEKRKTQRFEDIKKLGIDLSFEIKEGTTIEKAINDIPLDDAGQALFENMLAVWAALVEKAKGEKKEAASNEKVKETASAATKKPLLIVGGGKTDDSGSSKPSEAKFGKDSITVV